MKDSRLWNTEGHMVCYPAGEQPFAGVENSRARAFFAQTQASASFRHTGGEAVQEPQAAYKSQLAFVQSGLTHAQRRQIFWK